MLRKTTSAALFFLAAFAAAVFCGTTGAAAQQPSRKSAPPSFSKGTGAAKTGAPKPNLPVADEDVADACIGEALGQMFDMADEFYHNGEWNHCINTLRVVELGDPHNVETYSSAAYLLWSTDKGDLAIEQLKLGVANNPDTFYMYDEIGTHYWLRLKDAVSALPYLEKAIQFKCPWSTYHNLAFCYQKLNRWDKAVVTWRAATKFGDDVVAPMKLKQAEAHLNANKNSH